MILDLPPVILTRILSYITKDHKQLNLVCKKFYEIVCKIYEDKCWFQLKSYDIIVDDDKLKSLTYPIENCQLRQLKNLKLSYMQDVTADNSQTFWNFLNIQGQFIQNLIIESQINAEVFNKIISKVTNLKELSLEKFESNAENLNLCGLNSLKHLTVDACDNFDFKKLQITKNSLKSFKFNASYSNDDFSDSLKEFLSDQLSLKHAIFPKPYTKVHKLNHNILNGCKLEKLIWNQFYESDEKSMEVVLDMMMQQTELLELRLYIPLTDDLVAVLMENCQNLKIFSGNFHPAVLNMNNLMELEVINGDLDMLDVSKIKEHNLKTLTLNDCKFSDPSVIQNLAEVLNNLKCLKCKAANLKFDINIIFSKFFKVEELIFYEYCDMFREDSYMLYSRQIIENSNLKILKIHMPVSIKAQDVEDLVRKFPNLEDFEIYVHNKEQKSFKMELDVILQHLQKLQKLFITFAFTSEIDFDVFEMIHRKWNLTFLYIENVQFKNVEMKNKVEVLKDQFEEIEIGAEREYGYDAYFISLAKNYSIYCSKLNSIQDYIEVSTRNDERFFL